MNHQEQPTQQHLRSNETTTSTPAWFNQPSQNAQTLSNPPSRTIDWQFSFRGHATEYFHIWIKNLFLTIITLSLYSPWAKVRNLQYFYGNTYLYRQNFSFTAIPSRILIGRLIALSIFLFITITAELAPEYSSYSTLILIALAPWLIRSTMRFRARNSKYGNIRFIFSADLLKSYGILLACGILVAFSFGLAYPLAILLFKRYQLNHLQIGQLKFKLNASILDFYLAVLKPFILAIFIIIMNIILFATVASLNQSSILASMSMFIFAFSYILVILFLFPLMNAYLFQETWNNVNIGKNYTSTDISPFKYAWIQCSNYFAIIFSFGLLYPWAKVRLYQYKMEHLTIHFVDHPESLLNTQQNEQHALAEEITDIFDIDISL